MAIVVMMMMISCSLLLLSSIFKESLTFSHTFSIIASSESSSYPGSTTKPVGMWVTIGGELNRPAHTVRARWLLLNSKQRLQQQQA